MRFLTAILLLLICKSYSIIQFDQSGVSIIDGEPVAASIRELRTAQSNTASNDKARFLSFFGGTNFVATSGVEKVIDDATHHFTVDSESIALVTFDFSFYPTTYGKTATFTLEIDGVNYRTHVYGTNNEDRNLRLSASVQLSKGAHIVRAKVLTDYAFTFAGSSQQWGSNFYQIITVPTSWGVYNQISEAFADHTLASVDTEEELTDMSLSLNLETESVVLITVGLIMKTHSQATTVSYVPSTKYIGIKMMVDGAEETKVATFAVASHDSPGGALHLNTAVKLAAGAHDIKIVAKGDITGVAFTGERFLEAVVFPVDTGVYMSTQRQSSVIFSNVNFLSHKFPHFQSPGILTTFMTSAITLPHGNWAYHGISYNGAAPPNRSHAQSVVGALLPMAVCNRITTISADNPITVGGYFSPQSGSPNLGSSSYWADISVVSLYIPFSQ